MKRKIYIYEDSFLDKIQYFISILISIFFAMGLIPFVYIKVYIPIISLILIQIIISIIRLRILNIIIELILLILSIISIIPILGYITRFLGLIIGIIDTSTFKNSVIYEKIEIITKNKFNSYNHKNNKKRKEEKRNKKKFQDAEFEEK